MGLLPPTQGQLCVDGKPIEGGDIRAWQKTIAHVPQSIYLADSTLAENIAFGIPRDRIDLARVREAAASAQISQFIESHPDGYSALVGERGVRLSGGQRQRIGIARALYKKAEILVLDEATSALDNATEQDVMHAIRSADKNLTVIIVAHRLTTVRHCDRIYELRRGKVAASGTYTELLRTSDTFRNMAEQYS
jgi:ABC-type multidrug transport system fused ATPase/permease subunit